MRSFAMLEGWGTWLAVAAALLLGMTALPLPAQRFSESTDVVVVEVPVQVVRDGKPVRGLTAADFAIYEGRERQAITGFEVLDLAAVPADKPEAIRRLPMSARRRFVLLFDLGFSKPISMTRARSGGAEGPDRLAATFQPPQLQPGEYLLLVTLTDSKGKAETSVAPFVVQGSGGPAKTGGTGG